MSAAVVPGPRAEIEQSALPLEGTPVSQSSEAQNLPEALQAASTLGDDAEAASTPVLPTGEAILRMAAVLDSFCVFGSHRQMGDAPTREWLSSEVAELGFNVPYAPVFLDSLTDPKNMGPGVDEVPHASIEQAHQEYISIIQQAFPSCKARPVIESLDTRRNECYLRVLTVPRKDLPDFFKTARECWAIGNEDRMSKLAEMEEAHGDRLDGYVTLLYYGETEFSVTKRQHDDLEGLLNQNLVLERMSFVQFAMAYFDLKHVHQDGSPFDFLRSHAACPPFFHELGLSNLPGTGYVTLFTLVEFQEDDISRRKFAERILMSMLPLAVLLNRVDGGQRYMRLREAPMELRGINAALLSHRTTTEGVKCSFLRVIPLSASQNQQTPLLCDRAFRSLLGVGPEVELPAHFVAEYTKTSLTIPRHISNSSPEACFQRHFLFNKIASSRSNVCVAIIPGKTLFEQLDSAVRGRGEAVWTLTGTGEIVYKEPVFWANQQSKIHTKTDIGMFRWVRGDGADASKTLCLFVFVHDPGFLRHCWFRVANQTRPFFEEEFFRCTALAQVLLHAGSIGAWPDLTTSARDRPAQWGNDDTARRVSSLCLRMSDINLAIARASILVQTIATLRDPSCRVWHWASSHQGSTTDKQTIFINRTFDSTREGNGVRYVLKLAYSGSPPGPNTEYALGLVPHIVCPAELHSPLLAVYRRDSLSDPPRMIRWYSIWGLASHYVLVNGTRVPDDGVYSTSADPIFDVLIADGYITEDLRKSAFRAVFEEQRLRSKEKVNTSKRDRKSRKQRTDSRVWNGPDHDSLPPLPPRRKRTRPVRVSSGSLLPPPPPPPRRERTSAVRVGHESLPPPPQLPRRELTSAVRVGDPVDTTSRLVTTNLISNTPSDQALSQVAQFVSYFTSSDPSLLGWLDSEVVGRPFHAPTSYGLHVHATGQTECEECQRIDTVVSRAVPVSGDSLANQSRDDLLPPSKSGVPFTTPPALIDYDHASFMCATVQCMSAVMQPLNDRQALAQVKVSPDLHGTEAAVIFASFKVIMGQLLRHGPPYPVYRFANQLLSRYISDREPGVFTDNMLKCIGVVTRGAAASMFSALQVVSHICKTCQHVEGESNATITSLVLPVPAADDDTVLGVQQCLESALRATPSEHECKCSGRMEKTTTFPLLPKILVVRLAKSRQFHRQPVNVEAELDLSAFTDGPGEYDLYAAAHVRQGHFFSTVRIGNEWKACRDLGVTLLPSPFGPSTTASVLFYRRKEQSPLSTLRSNIGHEKRRASDIDGGRAKKVKL